MIMDSRIDVLKLLPGQTQTVVVYAERIEYRTQRRDGTWTDPVIQYHNPSESFQPGVHDRHSTHHTEFKHNFEGIWGYDYRNGVPVKRTITITSDEIVLTDPEWVDPEPWRVRGADDRASHCPEGEQAAWTYKPRTREQYDAEQQDRERSWLCDNGDEEESIDIREAFVAGAKWGRGETNG